VGTFLSTLVTSDLLMVNVLEAVVGCYVEHAALDAIKHGHQITDSILCFDPFFGQLALDVQMVVADAEFAAWTRCLGHQNADLDEVAKKAVPVLAHHVLCQVYPLAEAALQHIQMLLSFLKASRGTSLSGIAEDYLRAAVECQSLVSGSGLHGHSLHGLLYAHAALSDARVAVESVAAAVQAAKELDVRSALITLGYPGLWRKVLDFAERACAEAAELVERCDGRDGAPELPGILVELAAMVGLQGKAGMI
jgi:hypothetical protein